MDNVKVPKWVEQQLSKGEKVISTISTGGRLNLADYYATNKRLLRFTGKSNYDVLEFEKTSIILKKYGLGSSILRIFGVLFGLFCISLGILTYVGPTIRTGSTTLNLRAPFSFTLLSCGIGLFVIFIVLWGRYAYYQIECPGFDNKDLKKWRIERPRWGAGKIDRFAETIKERTGRS